MDSLDKKKHIHCSISIFKKTKALTSVIQIGDDQQGVLSSIIKRSSSSIIPKNFVPKIRPQKTKISPSFFILNEEKKIEKIENLENIENLEKLESKNVKDILSNEDNISLFSNTDSNSDNEKETSSDKLREVKKVDHNEIKEKLNLDKNNEEKNKNHSLSSLFNIRKKMTQIKNYSCLKRIKEFIDMNLSNLKKRFSIDNSYYDSKRVHDLNSKGEIFNYNKYNSSIIVGDNKNKGKIRSLLIFDVLTKAYQGSNL